MPAQGAQLLGEAVRRCLSCSREAAISSGPLSGAAWSKSSGRVGSSFHGLRLPLRRIEAVCRSATRPTKLRRLRPAFGLPAPEHLAAVGEQEEEDLLGEVFDLLPDVAPGGRPRAPQEEAAGHPALDDGRQRLDEPGERGLVSGQGRPDLAFYRLASQTLLPGSPARRSRGTRVRAAGKLRRPRGPPPMSRPGPAARHPPPERARRGSGGPSARRDGAVLPPVDPGSPVPALVARVRRSCPAASHRYSRIEMCF